jgi:hypothetical protein
MCVFRRLPAVQFFAAAAGRRKPVPIIEAACWSHWRRKFFDLAKLTKAPIAIEAVQKIDVLFEIERGINGLEPDMRVAVPTVNSILLAQNRESGDAPAHGGYAQTDLVGGHRAL